MNGENMRRTGERATSGNFREIATRPGLATSP